LSLTNQKALLPKVARKVFEDATVTSLGSTFHLIICFHLKNKFGKDPYEILLDDPKIFYNGLREILGEGAEAIISLVGTFITVKYKTSCTADEFTKLFTKSSEASKQQLSQMFTDLIKQEENKIKAT
jgi:hypothetical protein